MATACRLSQKSFDLITANMVVEHFRMPDLAFQEISRVLAPGGVVLMHTPNLANYLVFANRVISKVIPRRLHAAFVGTSEKRTEDEIYPAFYRANTEGKMRKVGSSVGNVSVEFLPAPVFPLFRAHRPWGIAADSDVASTPVSKIPDHTIGDHQEARSSVVDRSGSRSKLA